MPRRQTTFSQGCYYHIYNRGAHRERIFFNGENYLIHLCRYIHANPVKAGLVADPGEWPYSNYQEWVGERSGTLVDYEFVETYFPGQNQASGSLESPRRLYREFVLDYLRDTKSLPDDIRRYLSK